MTEEEIPGRSDNIIFVMSLKHLCSQTTTDHNGARSNKSDKVSSC